MILLVTVSLAALFALAGLFQLAGTRRDARKFPPPGHLIDVGRRRLHARIEGAGSPAVVFEAGFAASSVSWSGVHPLVSQFAACVLYDRAGLGWSDPPPGLFDAGTMVDDLAAILEKLAVPSPYVLVGHSFGGLLVRIFAERYPEKVAGLVLIDPVLACCWHQPDADRARVKRRAERISRWGVLAARLGLIRLATMPAVVSAVMIPRFGNHGEQGQGIVDRLQTELVKLPPETVPVIRSHWCRPQNFQTMIRHLESLEGSFSLLRNQHLDCPVTVISGGNLDAEGLAEHRSIAALSSSGEHVVARQSGHWIQFDEPELVVAAICRVARG